MIKNRDGAEASSALSGGESGKERPFCKNEIQDGRFSATLFKGLIFIAIPD